MDNSVSASYGGIKRVCMTMHVFPANVPIPINVPPRISTQNIIIAPSYSGAVAIWVAYFRFCGRRAPSVFSSVLSCSRPRSDGWPHHERTFSIYPCPLLFWLTLPRRVLSTSWCCPSRPCVAFLAFVHLTLTFLALSLSPGNSLVSSWCGHNIRPRSSVCGGIQTFHSYSYRRHVHGQDLATQNSVYSSWFARGQRGFDSVAIISHQDAEHHPSGTGLIYRPTWSCSIPRRSV